MARIAGVDIPRDKRVEIALTYIYGIGPTRSVKVLADTNIDKNIRVKDLTDDCLLYTSPSPRDRTRSRMPSSA